MGRLPARILYYGADRAPAERRALRAGPLSLVFENGDLRWVRLGGREVLRRVYVAVRDRDWGTAPIALSDLQIDAGEDAFRVTFEAVHQRDEIDFRWAGSVEGTARGTIAFTMDGEARSTFLRNRIGFCVLHPVAECAGMPCLVETVDGSTVRGAFPRHVSPHQPFTGMRAISHEVAPGVRAEVRFDGDTFEMEDQRNWTDASYKTYCTPLALPFPVDVREGTRVTQTITLSLEGAPSVHVPAGRGVTLTLAPEATRPAPAVGLAVASHGELLDPDELRRLRALGPAHLRVDLDLSGAAYEPALRRAAAEATALGAALEVAVSVSDAARDELRALARLLAEVRPAVRRWLVFHRAEKSTSRRWVDLAREALAAYDPAAQFGGGTNAYFAELNRERPPAGAFDVVCYSVNPQVHAFDEASLVETLAAQASTLGAAREFAGAAPLAVSPVTLKPRFNPNATGPAAGPPPGEPPPQVDARQMSLFGAGWTAGSLKHLSEGGAASVTFYETTGWLGVMERKAGPPLPEKFPSLPGGVFPLYHVLADFAEISGASIVPLETSEPLAVDGFALRKDGATRVVLANLGPEPGTVTLRGLGGRARIRRLNETNAEHAIKSPEEYRAREAPAEDVRDGALELDLLPFEVVRVDYLRGSS